MAINKRFWLKIYFAVLLAILASSANGKEVKADTCNSSVVLDNYGCEQDGCDLQGCDCGQITYLGGKTTYGCNTDLNQNPNCETWYAACSSNDEGGACEARSATDPDTGETSYWCAPVSCSKAGCWASGGPGASPSPTANCNYDGNCDSNENCTDCQADCGACPCIPVPAIDDQCILDVPHGGLANRQYLDGTINNPDHLVAVRNECGPTDTVAFNDRCDSRWFGVWDGYFEAPAEGDYEFMVKYDPVLSIKFDVDGNGSFSGEAACIAGSGRPKLGERFMFVSGSCNIIYRFRDLRLFLNGGTDPYPGCGDDGCDCWEDYETRTACEEGVHCGNADINASYYDYHQTTPYNTPANSRGTEECPLAQNAAEWTRNGEAWVWFTRHLTAGQHRMKINYQYGYSRTTTHYLKMWYRTPPAYTPDRPGTGGWIDPNTLALGADCPFSPKPDTRPECVPTVGWWQAVDGDIHADNGNIQSLIPDTVAAANKYLITSAAGGSGGVASYRPGRLVELGSGALDKLGHNWSYATTYQGPVTNYAYFESILAADPAGLQDWDGELPTGDGVYFHDGDISLTDSWNVPSSRKLVFLVNGSLNLTKNITINNNGFAAFIVSGDININGSVEELAGVYIANGIIDTGASAAALQAEGVFVGWTGFNLVRNLGDTVNKTTPAEVFTYRPDLIINAYQYLMKPHIFWQEVAP